MDFHQTLVDTFPDFFDRWFLDQKNLLTLSLHKQCPYCNSKNESSSLKNRFEF